MGTGFIEKADSPTAGSKHDVVVAKESHPHRYAVPFYRYRPVRWEPEFLHPRIHWGPRRDPAEQLAFFLCQNDRFS
jgi:hypothetical protein